MSLSQAPQAFHVRDQACQRALRIGDCARDTGQFGPRAIHEKLTW